ncbi:hypothetical protein Tco_0361397 [Tanacetum coccineum]
MVQRPLVEGGLDNESLKDCFPNLRNSHSALGEEEESQGQTPSGNKESNAGGILTLRSSKIILIECAAVSGLEGQPLAVNPAIEERIKVAINPEYPEQTIIIGSTLTEDGQNKLCDLLRRNLDVLLGSLWT